MSDVYDLLAKKLDNLPQGFPSTESGVELKILRRIFSPEDAELALNLRPIPETARTIAERLGRPVEEIRVTLDEMAKKGQIASQTMSREQVYIFIPFLPGIWEFQVILPVNTQIEAGSQVQRYEDVRKIVEQAKSFLVQDCQCRKERKILGHGCNHTIENCIQFSMHENAYDYFRLGGRIISREETLQILEKVEEEGLVHNAVYNTKKGHVSICNCCPCCCVALRGIKEFGAKHAVAKSNFVALIDQDTCSECGECSDERCPMEAIVEEDGGYRVLDDVCIGCGACTVTCPTESITLNLRPESEQDQPPENIADWVIKRASNRGIELKL
jgi:Pyruvate/2-oxoacid:ferredoxin oxidoreductase delta subunit